MHNKSIKSEQQQADFFKLTYQTTLKAVANPDASTYVIQLADTLIQLVFASKAMAGLLMSALAHLQITLDKTQTVDSHFYIWDTVGTKINMAPPPCTKNDFTDRGDIWGFNSARFRLAFHWSDFSVNLFDLEQNIGIFWVHNCQDLPYWAKASPLRTLFHWWMQKNQAQLLHAAAIGTEKGAVLITGKGGIGKSTTALAGLTHGLQYIGDDYVVVKTKPSPRVFSLYSSAKLNPEQVQQFPQLKAQDINIEQDEKFSFYLYPAFTQKISLSLPLVAVLTPEFSAEPHSELGPVSKELLQGAASLTTMSQLPYADYATYEFIGDLMAQCPGLKIKLANNLTDITQLIKDLIERPQYHLEKLSTTDTATKNYPLISVIIPVFNGANFLAEAIDNILQQHYPALEIIVIDDGSTDHLDQVIADLSVDIRYIKRKNKGPAAARNIGIKDASGEFIAFLDVDDLWPPNTLLSLFELLQQQPELELVHGHAQLMQLDKNTDTYDFIGNPLESFKHYIGAGLYRNSVFNKVGLFDRELKFAEDTDWYNRANELDIKRQRLDLVTLWVRRHGSNMTEGKTLQELNHIKVFKKMHDRRLLKNQGSDT